MINKYIYIYIVFSIYFLSALWLVPIRVIMPAAKHAQAERRFPAKTFQGKMFKHRCNAIFMKIIETFIPICKDNKKQNKEKFQ